MLWLLKLIFGLIMLEIVLFVLFIFISIIALIKYIAGGRKWAVKIDQSN